MPSFLTGLGNGLGTIMGGAGNAGAASSNAWNYGQYSPFTVNNPAGSIGWNGQTGTASLGAPGQALQSGLYGSANAGLGAAGGYNPNTSFLPQQYQQIFGQGFQDNVNSQFQHLQQAQAPWIQQGNQSNLDNQFSKGTLASTAGGYQTAGHDMANNALTQQNYNTAFQQANQLGANQFGAAQGVAGMGEQQQQFGAQQGLGLLNSSMTGINNQNSFLNQLMMTSGNLGAQRSGANVAAATPGIETGNIQDNATAGFLQNLLLGNGASGGLLTGLLGGGGSSSGNLMGSLGSLIGHGASSLGKMFSGGSGGDPSTAWANAPSDWAGNSSYTGGGGDPSAWNPGNGDNSGDPSNWYGGFNGAGGQATTSGSSGSSAPPVSSSSPFGGLASAGGYLSGIGGIASGISKGGVAGGIQAAGNVGSIYNKVTGQSGGFGGLLGKAGSALNIYNGLTSGTPQGVVSGLASGAGLAASSGAAGALGASAGTAAALGAAATGIGAVGAIPAVTQGIGDLVMGKLFGMDKETKQGNELGILRGKGGVQTVAGTAGQNTFGLGTAQKDYYNGQLLDPNKFQLPDNIQKASDLYLAGNMSAYQAFMNTMVKH